MKKIKPLELSQRQKDQLIEMANHYYPETNWHFWETEDEYDTIDDMTIGYNTTHKIGKGKAGDYPSLTIHWFEFCIRFLINDITITWMDAPLSIDQVLGKNLIKLLYKRFQKQLIK